MKPISDFLQQLIDEANQSLATSKERILYVYNQAIAEEYTPKEARQIVEEKIVNVSKRYLREVIPDEAKRTYVMSNSERTPKLENLQETKETVVNIPQPTPNIVDVEEEPIIQQPQERRTPEAPDNSMVQQLHHINIKLKKELQDLEELMDMRMADKDKRIHVLVKDVLDRDKAIQLLTEENTQLKAELGRHRRLEELRLEAQRKAIKEWRNPGDKP